MKFGALLLLSALMLHPQATAPRMEIVGKVVEPGTDLGIYDATVIVSRMEPREPGLTDAHIEVARLTTDAQGNFRFPATVAATYRLVAEKKGFRPPAASTLRGVLGAQAMIAVNMESPRKSVQLVLGQNGTVSGQVIDLNTGEPVANMLVQVSSYLPESGTPFLSLGAMTRTDSKGAFSVDAPPGRYVVWIFPQTAAGQRLMKTFTAADATATDMNYTPRFFPGGGADLASVFPIILPSGGRVDVGALRISKAPHFRARVHVGGACSPDQSVSIEDMVLTVRGTSSAVLGSVSCGSESLLSGLQPGRHTLTGTIGRTPSEMLTGNVPFVVTDGNLRLEIAVARGADIAGRVVTAEGAEKAPLDGVKFRLMPRPVSGDQRTASPSLDGRFALEHLRSGRKQLMVDGLSDQFYVTQIRFNGVPAAGGLFNVTGNASVEIEIDSQAAAIMGTTEQQDKPVAGADIVLIPWPMLPADDLNRISHFKADDKGAFRIRGLAPGEYRIFAVASTAWERSNEPAVWPSLIATAEKTVLSRGATQTLRVKLSEPR